MTSIDLSTLSQEEADLKLSRIPSLRFSFSWTLAGNVVYAGCQWGMISVLAKVGNAAIVGRFALGLAVTAPVFMFTNLQLRAVQATDARSEFAFADYFTLRLLASIFGLAAVCAIAAAGRYDRGTGFLILLVGVSKAIESLGDVIAGLLQKAERLNRVSLSLMMRGGFSLLAFGGAFWMSRNLAAAVIALTAVWFSVFTLYDLYQARLLIRSQDRFFSFRWPQLKKLVIISGPLGIVTALLSLNVNIPRYFIERHLGTEELGIFASLAYLIVAINVVVSALGQTVSTRLARHFALAEFAQFRRILKHLLWIGLSILALALPLTILFGRELVELLYTPQYSQRMPVLLIIVTTASVNAIASFLGTGVTAARCFRAQVPIFIFVTVTTAFFSSILVPRFGLIGAATALLISTSVLAAGNLLLLYAALKSATRPYA